MYTLHDYFQKETSLKSSVILFADGLKKMDGNAHNAGFLFIRFRNTRNRVYKRKGASEGVDRVSARAGRATKRTLWVPDDFFVTISSFNSVSGFERTI